MSLDKNNPLRNAREAGMYSQNDLTEQMMDSVSNADGESKTTAQTQDGGHMIAAALGLTPNPPGVKDDDDEQQDSDNNAETHDEEETETTEEVEEDGEKDDDSSEEDADTDSSDTDSEADDDEEDDTSFESDYLYKNDKGREIFLEATDIETGESSIYLTRDEAKKGLERQLNLIGTLKEENEALETDHENKLGRANEELAFYRTAINKESLRAMLILSRMPEDQRGVDPVKLNDTEKLRTYEQARARAEAKLDVEVEQGKKDANALIETRKTRTVASQTFVTKLLKDEKFVGIRNAENKVALSKRLKTKVSTPGGEEFTLRKMVELVTDEFGEDFGKIFLNGVVIEFRSDTQKEVSKTVKKAAKNIKTKRRVTKANPNKKPSGERNANDMILGALEDEKRDRSRRHRQPY